jgi:prepilin-type processing-associated H-X9-DG protein
MAFVHSKANKERGIHHMKFVRVPGSKNNLEAFGRLELIITISVIVVLALLGWAFMAKGKAVQKDTVCVDNLKHLGMGMAMYTGANDQKLPYAFIHHDNAKQFVWDGLMGSYLRAAIRGDDKSKPAPELGNLLLCPEDKVPPLEFAVKYGFPRRTYAMPWHSMDNMNWPVASTNTTGVGLWWASYGQGNTSVKQLTNYLAGGLPAIRLSMIPDPMETMLLTEQAKSNNIARNSSGGRIKYTADHLETEVTDPASYQEGKINYLMIDGHVETLSPEATVGPRGRTGAGWNTHFGIWSIRAGD